jgi:single-strand DNA-binding protein
LYVEGRLKYGKFTNKDGHEQNTCDIVATEMQLLGSRQGMGAPSGDEGGGSSSGGGSGSGGGGNYNARPASAPRAPSAPAQQRPAAAKPAASGFDDMDDDIPF